MREIDPNACIDFIFENAPKFAKAKAELAELENYKSSLKSILMKKSGENAVNAQEREAYSSPDYQNLCKAIGEATEKVELLRWQLEAAKLRFEVWRTQQANERQLDKMLKVSA